MRVSFAKCYLLEEQCQRYLGCRSKSGDLQWVVLRNSLPCILNQQQRRRYLRGSLSKKLDLKHCVGGVTGGGRGTCGGSSQGSRCARRGKDGDGQGQGRAGSGNGGDNGSGAWAVVSAARAAGAGRGVRVGRARPACARHGSRAREGCGGAGGGARGTGSARLDARQLVGMAVCKQCEDADLGV